MCFFQLVCHVYPDFLAPDINQLNLLLYIHQFLAHTTRPDSNNDTQSHISNISDSSLPTFLNKISIYTSAVTSFYVPSDICGIKGMCRERIHTLPSWRKGAPRYDTILVEMDPKYTGMSGTDVAQVKLFLSFRYEGIEY